MLTVINLGDPSVRTPKINGVVPGGLLKKLSSVPYFDIHVLPAAERMKLILPSGENYLLDAAGMEFVLKSLGATEDMILSITSYVHSFREITLEMPSLIALSVYEENRKLNKFGERDGIPRA